MVDMKRKEAIEQLRAMTKDVVLRFFGSMPQEDRVKLSNVVDTSMSLDEVRFDEKKQQLRIFLKFPGKKLRNKRWNK